ncbi:hypothetical protein I4U23_000343 [Adineta vaga]|nr:hypothetical protein I4U23_000343 [Adineta vaga]
MNETASDMYEQLICSASILSSSSSRTTGKKGIKGDPIVTGIRLRPFFERESSIDDIPAVQIFETNVICTQNGRPQIFKFTNCFDSLANNKDVYDGMIRSAVLASLQGYNTTVLAYGQTASGDLYFEEIQTCRFKATCRNDRLSATYGIVDYFKCAFNVTEGSKAISLCSLPSNTHPQDENELFVKLDENEENKLQKVFDKLYCSLNKSSQSVEAELHRTLYPQERVRIVYDGGKFYDAQLIRFATETQNW